MGCQNNTTNPCGLKAVATVADGVRTDIGLNRSLSISLVMPKRSEIMHSRLRTVKYDDEDSYSVAGAELCQMTSGEAYATLTGSTTKTYVARLEDEATIFDSKIMFMDLRHDILVFSRAERHYVINETSEQSVGGRGQFSGPSLRHLIGPVTVSISGADKIIQNGVVVSEKPVTINPAPFHLAPEQDDHWFPTPDTDPPIIDEWEYPYTRRFFWPIWVEAATADTRYDVQDANILINPLPDAQSGSYSPMEAFCSELVDGSWVVARDGSSFFTQCIDGQNKTEVKNADNYYYVGADMGTNSEDVICYPVGLW